ncbi:hypothetical protein J2R99_000740 [Rhodopseudomonas julia]|uniref:Uncharacterized protein n=1 Tax=Rhodopseudomonas julia TaxID=200617 RepID=A0ABU0C4M4_9BRAD|nr:hypothetical protein [Rhodopseudomonas julia]MDQ0324891.1 hypothetical protein [Rhodopseudomonas julia]
MVEMATACAVRPVLTNADCSAVRQHGEGHVAALAQSPMRHAP